MTEIDQQKITLFRSLFRGRENVFAKYWAVPNSSKSGYSPVYRLNDKQNSLNDSVILSHLQGKELIGIYPLLSDNSTYFLAIDFDGVNWLTESTKLVNIAKTHDLPCYLERSKSGNGGHVWFFFETNIPAWKARRLGKFLLIQAKVTTRQTYDRMFPSQDEHHGKGFGNLIALPLQGEYLKRGNTAFIDLSGNIISDQWNYLASFVKISETSIEKLLGGGSPTAPEQQKKSTEKVQVSPEIVEEEKMVKTTDSPEVKLVLENQIFIPELFLPDKLYKSFKEKLNFPNPKFYEMERRGYSTWQTPRWIKNIEIINGGIFVPAGILSEIKNFCSANNLKLTIEDKQVTCPSIVFKAKIELRPEQKQIVSELLKQDRVILEAKPGFGKTITALYCLTKRKQPILIIVHTRALLHQWKKTIETLFEMEKGDLGIIGENKLQSGKKITIASYQTLTRRDLNEIKDKFGFVIIDECHHVPANTFSKVLKELPTKYVLGLTATAIRHDKLERLLTFYIGPIVKAIDSKNTSTIDSENDSAVETKLITKRTNFKLDGKGSEFNEIAAEIVSNVERNQLIIDDVTAAIKSNKKCLILTERVDHCDTLLKLLRENAKGIHATTVTGIITKKKREQLAQRIHQDRFQLIVATGKLIGEGFDWPELTHLFLVFPFSWKGKIVQYIGRVQRKVDGKETAFVYDYIDYAVPMLRIMYFKRLRAYRSLGLTKEEAKSTKFTTKVSENQLAFFN